MRGRVGVCADVLSASAKYVMKAQCWSEIFTGK